MVFRCLCREASVASYNFARAYSNSDTNPISRSAIYRNTDRKNYHSVILNISFKAEPPKSRHYLSMTSGIRPLQPEIIQFPAQKNQVSPGGPVKRVKKGCPCFVLGPNKLAWVGGVVFSFCRWHNCNITFLVILIPQSVIAVESDERPNYRKMPSQNTVQRCNVGEGVSPHE